MPTARHMQLVAKSRAACLSAVETYNCASALYREETFAILMINAWALLLKARIMREHGGKPSSIHEFKARKKKDGSPSKLKEVKRTRSSAPMTIGIDRCWKLVSGYPKDRVDQACIANMRRCSRSATASAVREVAGKRARDEAAMLDRMMEQLRLASFRSYLAATVVSMSVLVPEVLELGSSGMADAMQRLRPGHIWPSVTAREAEYGRTGPATNRMVKPGRQLSRRPAPLMGDAVMSEGVFGPVVEAKVFGGSLDVVLRADGFRLSTMDGVGYLMFDQMLPDTIVAALPGRRLSDVLDHVLLHGRGFVISNAAQVGGGSSLAFDVGRLPVDVPWRP